jgi:hypothetical protein
MLCIESEMLGAEPINLQQNNNSQRKKLIELLSHLNMPVCSKTHLLQSKVSQISGGETPGPRFKTVSLYMQRGKTGISEKRNKSNNLRGDKNILGHP